MSRILPSTLLQQQSYNPDWVIGSTAIPTGIVVSCQITTMSHSPIYLSSFTVSSEGLSIVFSQDDIPCAYGVVARGSSIVSLTTQATVLSATLELGAIPHKDISINARDLRVNPYYVNVVSTTGSSKNSLTIVQDEYSNTYELNSDIDIALSDNIEGTYNEDTGELVLSMSPEDYLDFTQIGGDILVPDNSVSNINGVRAKNGKIKINIYNSGVPVLVHQLAANWASIEHNGPISFCPDYIDILDNYISPSMHIGYYPLDDVYNDAGQRDTSLIEDRSYGGFTLGNKCKLTDIDENIDVKPATAE